MDHCTGYAGPLNKRHKRRFHGHADLRVNHAGMKHRNSWGDAVKKRPHLLPPGLKHKDIGTYGTSEFAKQLSYIEPANFWPIPFAHALLYGVVKAFWGQLLKAKSRGMSVQHLLTLQHYRPHADLQCRPALCKLTLTCIVRPACLLTYVPCDTMYLCYRNLPVVSHCMVRASLHYYLLQQLRHHALIGTCR